MATIKGRFRCAMCGGIFPFEWSDAQAKAEQTAVGISDDEPVAMVCDDCYALTPWGKKAAELKAVGIHPFQHN